MVDLPPPVQNQAYCHVSALEGGMINLPHEIFLDNAVPGTVTIAPSLAFLLRHSKTDEKFVFDLGIRKDWENSPPATLQWIKDFFPVHVTQDAIDSLAKGGLSPSDISTVCLSHCHWDHTGNTNFFDKSTILLGEGSASLLNPGYPADPSSGFESAFFPPERTKFLRTFEWPALGPFPHALDYYGDGSLYVVDAAGHLPGHIILVARTSADGGWILLGGDSAHHWALIKGESEIAVGRPGFSSGCAHHDKAASALNLKRIRQFIQLPRTQVILAHDEPWYSKNKGGDAFWPGVIPSA